jgi:hypothetical protein
MPSFSLILILSIQLWNDFANPKAKCLFLVNSDKLFKNTQIKTIINYDDNKLVQMSRTSSAVS